MNFSDFPGLLFPECASSSASSSSCEEEQVLAEFFGPGSDLCFAPRFEESCKSFFDVTMEEATAIITTSTASSASSSDDDEGTLIQAPSLVCCKNVSSPSLPLDSSSPIPSKNITTITATVGLSQAINLRRLARFLLGGNVIYDPCSIALETARGATKRSFQNQACVEIEVEKGRRVTASVFSNGTVKFTGCKSFAECDKAATELEDRIRRTPRNIVANPSLLTRSQPLEIVMIKCDFDFGFHIVLANILSILQANGLQYSYEPERYCAVKVHVPLPTRPKPVTVCVFHTGKIFVTGHITLDEVKLAFDAVSLPILACRHLVEADPATAAASSSNSKKASPAAAAKKAAAAAKRAAKEAAKVAKAEAAAAAKKTTGVKRGAKKISTSSPPPPPPPPLLLLPLLHSSHVTEAIAAVSAVCEQGRQKRSRVSPLPPFASTTRAA